MATPNVTTVTAKENSREEVTSVKFDLIAHLPVHIVEKIFFYLSAEDLHSATSCCLNWGAAVSNDSFWKKLCKRYDYFEVEENYKSELYTDCLKRHNHWQGVYWYHYTLQRNWETNNYRQETHKIEEFDDDLRWFLGDDVFAYYSVNNTKLHVYNLKLKELEPITFSIRPNPDFDYRLDVPEFFQSGKYLIHGVFDTSLTVWNIDNGTTVFDQLCEFTSIHVDKTLILLETWKEKFQVHDIETGKIEYERKEITSVIIMNGKIGFITTDNAIHILKWADKSEVIINCCNQTLDRMILIKDDFLLSFCECSRNVRTLCVWDIETKTKLHSIDLGNLYYMESVCLMNKYLYLERKSRNDVALIELWDYTKGTCVANVNRLYSSSRLSNDNFMIASNSCKIGLWSFRTMEFISNVNLGHYSVGFIRDVELSKTKIVSIEHIRPFIILYVKDYEI